MPDAYKSIWLVVIIEYSKTKITSHNNYCVVKKLWQLNKFGKLQPIHPSDEAIRALKYASKPRIHQYFKNQTFLLYRQCRNVN